MNKFIQLLKSSREWLESDALTKLLSEPVRVPQYNEYIGRHAVMLTLDVSPSMLYDDYHPTRLEGAKQAARRYLRTIAQREPLTLVGMVDFHEQAELVSHPMPVGERTTDLSLALTRLHSGMGTNIGAGLKLAARELERIASAANPTVILLTDGASNHGPNPVQVAATLKAKAIQLDIIGIGGSPCDVNEPDLKQMASVVNGQLRYWFIRSSDALIDRFEALALREIR